MFDVENAVYPMLVCHVCATHVLHVHVQPSIPLPSRRRRGPGRGPRDRSPAPLPAPGGRPRALELVHGSPSARAVVLPFRVACSPAAWRMPMRRMRCRGAAGRTGRGTVGLRIGPDQRNASRNDDRTRRVCAERLIKSLP